MSEKITEKKSVEEFIKSAKYADLKKELAESIASVELNGEDEKSDRDISPALDLFEKETMKQGLSEVQAERLLWQTVANEMSPTFGDINTMIRQYVEDANYEEARKLVVDELNKLIDQLSHTVYKNLSKRSVAFTVLKEEFYKLFPEVESLIEPTEEERRAKIKRPTGESGQKENEDETWEREKGRYLVEELEWPVPKSSELVPGLMVALSDQEAKRMENIEFLEYPHFEDGDLFVKVKWNGEEGSIKLFNFGLAADVETGLWNSRYKPLLWEIKEKK